jgi:hypothetical protein
MILAVALASTFLTAQAAPRPAAPPAAPQAASSCLHDPSDEPVDQMRRRVAALGAARAVNTAESAHSAKAGGYATGAELAKSIDAAKYNLAADADIVPGFTLTLDTTPKGYWFEIKDAADPCGFRFISNQSGLIFTAEPIR